VLVVLCYCALQVTLELHKISKDLMSAKIDAETATTRPTTTTTTTRR